MRSQILGDFYVSVNRTAEGAALVFHHQNRERTIEWLMVGVFLASAATYNMVFWWMLRLFKLDVRQCQDFIILRIRYFFDEKKVITYNIPFLSLMKNVGTKIEGQRIFSSNIQRHFLMRWQNPKSKLFKGKEAPLSCLLTL